MKYELAKRLKDGGFPQNTQYASALSPWNKGAENRLIQHMNIDKDNNGYANLLANGYDVVALSNLSELIEACYDSAYKRKPASVGFTLSSGPQDGKWGAEMFSIFDYELPDTKKVVGSGSTPEVAVAELWLALNKKK